MMMDDPKSRALRVIAEKANSLYSPKWTDLDSARLQVALHLMPDESEIDESEIDEAVVDEALRHAGAFLIEAFASGDLRTRGIEHHPDALPVLHRRLPGIWWERVFENADDVPADELDFPVHLLSWSTSRIVRWPDPSISTVTDIKVEVARLNRFAPAQENASTDAVRRKMGKRPGKKPNEAQHVEVRAIFKGLLQDPNVMRDVNGEHGTIARVQRLVAERYQQNHADGIEEKQVGRILFGG